MTELTTINDEEDIPADDFDTEETLAFILGRISEDIIED
tara:strand:+ start:1054 stop:1170 length:117 start_codon:yes stop_codon:yes gene_type:complete